jgi:hypothetical protein
MFVVQFVHFTNGTVATIGKYETREEAEEMCRDMRFVYNEKNWDCKITEVQQIN